MLVKQQHQQQTAVQQKKYPKRFRTTTTTRTNTHVVSSSSCWNIQQTFLVPRFFPLTRVLEHAQMRFSDDRIVIMSP